MTTVDTTKTYSMTNGFSGAGHFFGVSGSSLVMDSSDDDTALWNLVDSGVSPYYYFHTLSGGPQLALDVDNDNGTNSINLKMTTTGKYSGQYWRLDSWDDGTIRLSNNFTGPDMHLDVYSNTLQPYLASGDHTGQHWTVIVIEAPSSTASSSATTTTVTATATAASQSGGNSPALSGGAIAGIAIGGVVILAVAAFALFMLLRKRGRKNSAPAPAPAPAPGPVQGGGYAEPKIDPYPQPIHSTSPPPVYNSHVQAYQHYGVASPPPPPAPVELPQSEPPRPVELS